MAGLDGLRALAVLAVLLYHARDIAGLPGVLRPASGFLGVEVFFVISGYLITALLVGEHARDGAIRLRAFWGRRARRLLPALYVLLAAVVLVAVLGTDVGSLRGELAASLVYVSNWLLIVQDTSYFESAGRPSLLQHLWSLAVEEQFYLLWPLVLFAGLRWLGHRTLFALTAAAAVASTALAWMLFDRLDTYGDVTAIYYRTDARAAGLLIGAAVAFVWRPWEADEHHTEATHGAQRWTVELAGTIALAGVIWAQYAFSDQVVEWGAQQRLYHAGFLLTSIPTVVLIAVVVTPGSLIGRALGNRVLRWAGTRSYALYLWHWPIYQLTRPRVDVDFDGWTLLALRIALTVVLAELSYRLVERPIRERRFARGLRRGLPSVSRRRVALGFANGGAVLTVAALALALPALDRGSSTLVASTPERSVVVRTELARPPSSVADLPVADSGPVAGPEAVEPDVIELETLAPTPSATPPRAVAAPALPAPDTDPSATPAVVEPPPASATTQPTAEPTAVLEPSASPTAVAPPVVTPPRSFGSATMTVVGDSVVLGASTELAKIGEGVSVHGQVGRQWWQITSELQALADAGQLGDTVVIQLGNNGTLTAAIFDEVMAVLADAKVVLFVNVRVPKSWEGDVNAAIAAGVARHAPRARLADWYGASNEHPEFFLPDGVHLEHPGSEALRELIVSALAE